MRWFLAADQQFTAPGWLWLLLLLPVLVLFYRLFIRKHFPGFLISQIPGNTDNQTRPFYRFSPPDLLFILRVISLGFLLLTLANLVEEKQTRHPLPAAGIDIVLALDLSRSMTIEDIKPSRLEALKDVLNQFIASRSQDRIGLVLYAGESMNWCPLTKDYPFLLTRLQEMDEKHLNDGTAIGLGLASSVNALKGSKAKSKVVVLLTDGANNTGFINPVTAAQIAKKHHVKVYTIGIGTNGLAPFPMLDMDGKKTYQYVKVSLDENMLKKIAAETGGQYFRATNAQTLSKIYSEIDKLEKTKQGFRIEKVQLPLFQVFLLIALSFLLLEQLLKYTLFLSFS